MSFRDGRMFQTRSVKFRVSFIFTLRVAAANGSVLQRQMTLIDLVYAASHFGCPTTHSILESAEIMK